MLFSVSFTAELDYLPGIAETEAEYYERFEDTLGEDWQLYYTDEGYAYYYNASTDESRWEADFQYLGEAPGVATAGVATAAEDGERGMNFEIVHYILAGLYFNTCFIRV